MSFEKDLFRLRISPLAKLSMMLIGALITVRESRESPPNPAFHPTGYSQLRWLPSAGEFKRWASLSHE
jgi:hypothetical protein